MMHKETDANEISSGPCILSAVEVGNVGDAGRDPVMRRYSVAETLQMTASGKSLCFQVESARRCRRGC